MTIHYVTVRGYIRDGKLEIDLPDNAADGEVAVDVPVSPMPADDEPLHFEGRTAGEILRYVLAEAGDELDHIADSAAWVENLRRAEEERHNR